MNHTFRLLLRVNYTLLLVLFSPFLLTILLKKKTGKPSVGKRWKEYFGFTPKMDTNAPFWIHTVSVGETIAAIPLIKALKRKYPAEPSCSPPLLLQGQSKLKNWESLSSTGICLLTSLGVSVVFFEQQNQAVC